MTSPRLSAVDLCAQRVALDADVGDAGDPAEIAGESPIISALIDVRDRWRIDSRVPLSTVLPARMMVTRSQRASVSARMWLDSSTVAPPVAGLGHALLKDVLHQGIQAAARFVEQEQPRVDEKAEINETFCRLPFE